MSKRFFKWPQVELVSPGASRLTMQHQIGIGDRIDGKQAVLAFRANIVGEVGGRVFALDDAVYDDMRDMDTLRSKFTRQPLRYGA
jgi:hypothetical protein